MIMSGKTLSKCLTRKETWCYIGVVLSVGILTAMSQQLDPSHMQIYFGVISPYLLLVILAAVGGWLTGYLRRFHFGFCHFRFEGFIRAIALATLFGVVIIGVEHLVPLDQDINVPYPDSLAFYPAIAFYVEIIFHVIPIALLLYLASSFSDWTKLEERIWLIFIAVAVIEPLFQTILNNTGQSATLTVYVALHIFLINLTQLHLFRKYDFVTMFFFRIIYYLIWHVLWGHFRLEILF